jgi:hypothetical protein
MNKKLLYKGYNTEGYGRMKDEDEDERAVASGGFAERVYRSIEQTLNVHMQGFP